MNTDRLKELISEHGPLYKVVHVPPTKERPRGHLMIEFQDGYVELATELCVCKEHLERLAAVSGMQPRRIEWALKQSKVEEFVVWSDPHAVE